MIVWLAQNRQTADYAIGEQFLTDIKELTEIFKGNGPNYGPLYIVLFTELETYPPAGEPASENYKRALSDNYLKAVEIIRDTYDKAQVGLGFGGYSWPEQVPASRDVARWEEAIAVSDFTCVQQMQSYRNWHQLPGKIRNSVRQLGTYDKPVMISHFKIWSGGPDDNPDPYEKKVADAQGAFDNFMDDMFTEASLSSLYADGLRAWVFMNDEYIRKHCDDDEVYLRAMNFVKNHNDKNPLISRQVFPPPPIESVDMLLEFPFDDGSWEAVISSEAGFTASPLTNRYLSFDIFSTPDDPHAENGGKWIQDHGQGPDHVNALNEGEAINPNSGNQKNNYLSFTVTPENGNQLDFSWLSFDIQARTGDPDNPPSLTYHAALYSSLQGWNSRIGSSISVSSNDENSVSGWKTLAVDLTKLAFGVDEPVEFRIYFWRVGNTEQRYERWVEIDNIRLYAPGDGSSAIGSPSDAPAASYRMYPNPAKEQVEIAGLSGNEDIRIFGIDGQFIRGFTSRTEKERLPLNTMKPGIYFVKINKRPDTGAAVLKLIIK